MISRRLAFVLSSLAFLVGVPFVHGVIPWVLSLFGQRHGWINGYPAIWNWFGALPIAIAAVTLVWAMVQGFLQAAEVPERIKLDWSPKILLTQGPYAICRHPIYLAELGLWLGWAILYGSGLVFFGFLLACIIANKLAVHEENALAATFAEKYAKYAASVPRWPLGRRHGDHLRCALSPD